MGTTLKARIGNGYLDEDGLVTPNRNGSSDNGVMYTGEYAWLLHKNGELSTLVSAAPLATSLDRCFRIPGLLSRHPDGTGGQEGPDDYLGACLLTKALSTLKGINPIWGNDILWYGMAHLGTFRNDTSGSILSAFLWRQPQLIAAALACASWCWYEKPMAWLLERPFMWYAALSIAVSCRQVPILDTDPRRLSWILIQLTEEKSYLCRLAARGWYERLNQDYGPEGMKAVAKIYYEQDHPFSLYHESGDRKYLGAM